ncbi:MAG: 4-hydroxy-tetrahydrodipicolinate reductase [Crocinitomicaceae bacterium]|nr:4-hydroxy-tetrahydrodipicolinate reductase [Crocinitomicaceae bacterium]
MNIALIGYGKMGRIIEETAIARGHRIVAKSSSEHPIETVDFSKVDIAIEFTAPHIAVKHIEHCVDNNIPVVVGTTAWNEQLPHVKEYVTKHEGSILYASNFSIGVNIFFDINRRLSKLMEPHKEYDVRVDEIHHLQKLDAPSGTAISLADDILIENDNLSSWIHKENEVPHTKHGQIPIISHREDGVPGTHIIEYNSVIDNIQLKHTAYNRKGFALGSVIAAEWLVGKKGIFTMRDVIK